MDPNNRKVALVTGGAQGIGKAVAQSFSHQGYVVYIADIDQEAGDEAVQWLSEKGGELRFTLADVSQEKEVRRLIDQIASETARLDVLINNAGQSVFAKMGETGMDYFDSVIANNLRSAYMCSKFAVPLLRAQGGGAIINMASTRALMSEPDTEAYAASKGGLLALTHALASSLSPQVRVNAISPGWIETRDWRKSSERQTIAHRPQDKAQHLVGRVGTPEDIGRAAVFLCSGEASFITGQNLVIDGGMTVKMIYEA